ncbi:RNA polymerase sigma factor [Snuella sedimenti]|uniref:Sigma-70 family RNA polymerase sigma factor n=1 Tax=Snuella sedimenti TaxID=2798802 RepID=A0A8J7IZW7_9FLAO|nr:sigma-70 family RNA polymerase sigma factor [Snuella sedimenti]MBJ6366907.1 sigma-70 family RNA polymerase sigma factor [Snuella sedimenti]
MRELEEDMWHKFVSGDQKAFATIYNSNVDSLFSYGMRVFSNRDFVKDCIQDVFLDIYEHRKQLSIPKNINHYLFIALKRSMFKKLKKERKKGDFSEFETFSFITEHNIESRTIDKEIKEHQKKLLREIVKELTSKQQEILYLRFSKGFDYIEISEIVDIDHNSVRKQVYRAIKKLRQNKAFKSISQIILFYSLIDC